MQINAENCIRNADECREMYKNAEKCREVQRNVEKCSALCICDDMIIVIIVVPRSASSADKLDITGLRCWGFNFS